MVKLLVTLNNLTELESGIGEQRVGFKQPVTSLHLNFQSHIVLGN